MSSGPPPLPPGYGAAPSPGPAPGGATLDDAVEELRNLVNLGEIQNHILNAVENLLGGGASPGSGGGGGGGGAPIPGGPPAPKSGKEETTVFGLPIGKLAEIGIVVAAFRKAVTAVDDWTEAAMDSVKRLSEISGSMAGVQAEREIRQMQRDIKRGEATAGTANELMQSESRRKEQENRIGVVIDNATNRILAALNDVLAKWLVPVADWLERIAKKIGVDLPVPPAGLAATMPDIMEASRRLDARADGMMAAARAAAAAAGGVAPAPAPAGGVPALGRMP